jgi:hypothetical protein
MPTIFGPIHPLSALDELRSVVPTLRAEIQARPVSINLHGIRGDGYIGVHQGQVEGHRFPAPNIQVLHVGNVLAVTKGQIAYRIDPACDVDPE